jgi:GTP-binding protein
MFRIALIGKPNVGKTAIFNRLCSKKGGIVYDQPGVTRDINEANMKLYGVVAKLVDTGGIDEKLRGEISKINKQVIEQAKQIAMQADLIFFVIDGRDGVSNDDKNISYFLRQYANKVVVLINKVENELNQDIKDAVDEIGFENVVHISAEHNLGFVELYKIVNPFYQSWIEKNPQNKNKEETIEEIENLNSKVIKIAVIGRPNAGKSTLINNILNEKRVIVSEIAGTTRDKVEIDLQHKGRDLQIIDTAGIRKKLAITEELEKKTVESSFEAIKFCHLALLVIDVEHALEDQDLALARILQEEGRGLMIIFNKWDKVNNEMESKLLEELKKKISRTISIIKDPIFFTMSALNEKNIREQILNECVEMYDKLAIKISTSKLNNWLAKMNTEVKMPFIGKHQLKIKYATQNSSKPPSFYLFGNFNDDSIPSNCVEHIRKHLMQSFDLMSLPVRIAIKKSKK